MRRPFDHDFVTRIVSLVGTPCLVAHSLTSLHVDGAVLRSMAEANCMVILGESQGSVCAGDWVDVVVFDGLV